MMGFHRIGKEHLHVCHLTWPNIKLFKLPRDKLSI